MNPLGALLTLAFSLGAMILPKPLAGAAVIATLCFLTQGQALSLAGFNFTAIRIVLLCAVVGVIRRGDFSRIQWNKIDKAFFRFVVVLTIFSFLGRGTGDSLVYQIGWDYNMILAYLTFRSFTGLDEVRQFLGAIVWLLVPFAFLMMFEGATGRNVLAAFGGVLPFDELRDGHYRACGGFRSPITAGTFGATLAAIFGGLLFDQRHRRIAIIGFSSATVITVAAHSSGPLLAYAGGVCAFLCWGIRHNLKLLRRSIVFGLLGLHLVMKAPVWFLIAKMSDLVGGGGWHRAYLVDRAVYYFQSWWLFGTTDTGDWMPTQLALNSQADITNHFVSIGINGGLFSLICFIALYVSAFKSLGRVMRALGEFSNSEVLFLWGFGAALVVSIFNSFSVSYFDQIEVILYMLFSICAVLAGVPKPVTSEIVDSASEPDAPSSQLTVSFN